VQFTCFWRWFLPDDIMEELRDDTTIPGLKTELPQHHLDLEEKVQNLIDKKIEEIMTTPPEPEIIPEEPEVPLTTEERQVDDSIKKLDQCLRGLGAWAAYQGQTEIEYFIDQSRWQFADRDNLSQNIPILRILKAIEECDIMRTYERMHLIGDYELNKVLADLAGKDYLGRGAEHPLAQKVTDQSDAMVETDPVTPKDIADEIEEMEALRDKLIEERKFEDPYAELPDVDRQPAGLKCQAGGQPTELGEYPDQVCPLDAYNTHIRDNPTLVYSDYLQLQCKYYLNMYIHKVGTDDFPQWLNHCVPKVVRE